MSVVKCIDLELVRKLGRNNDVSRNLLKLDTEGERVCYIYDLLHNLNIVPKYIRTSLYKKSVSDSVTLRLEGNSMFKCHQYGEALMLYTKSIAKSPFPSECLTDSSFIPSSELDTIQSVSRSELVYSFGNRSAVLYAMGYYDLCLKDIERARILNCPPELVIKLEKRKACCLMLKDEECDALQSSEHYMAQLSLEKFSNHEKSEVKATLHETEKKIIDSRNKASTKKGRKKHSFFENLKVSYGPHEKIRNASKCIDVGYFETMGHGLLATRDIAVGDVLLIEDPFGGNIFEDNYYSYCSHCFTFCRALIPCFRCSFAMFCSEVCRKESWVQYHHTECFANACDDFSQEVLKLALRLTVTASSQHKCLVDFCNWVKMIEESVKSNDFDIKERGYSADYRGIYHMMRNTEKTPEKQSFVETVSAVCLVEFLHAETQYFCSVPKEKVIEVKKLIAELLLRHINIARLNIHQIAEYRRSGRREFTKHAVALALYPVHSLLNHSCCPNVLRVSYKGKMVLIARRPIQQGQQILDCYKNYYSLHDFEERCHHLETTYFFKCKCEACVEKWPTYDHLPDHLSTFKCQGCGTLLSKVQSKKHTVLCKKCYTKNEITKIEYHILSSYKTSDDYLASTTPRRNAAGEYIELPDPLICLRATASLLQDWEMYIKPTWKKYDCVQGAFAMALDELSSLSME